MRRIRISIAGLMAVVLACGLGVAALKNASDLWAALAFTMALGMLGLATLGATYRRGERRAFWVGFALFGGSYWLLAFGPWFEERVKPRLATSPLIDLAHARLHPAPAVAGLVFADFDNDGDLDLFVSSTSGTSKVAEITKFVDVTDSTSPGGDAAWVDLGNPPVRQPDGTLVKPLARLSTASERLYTTLVAGTTPARPANTLEPFRRVGHALFVLLVGLAGGLAGRYFRGTLRTDPMGTRPPCPDDASCPSPASTGDA